MSNSRYPIWPLDGDEVQKRKAADFLPPSHFSPLLPTIPPLTQSLLGQETVAQSSCRLLPLT